MKAISLHQPWASLIACGAKPYETRNWPPPWPLIGQRIAIHAAKRIDADAADLADEICYGQIAMDEVRANLLDELLEETPDELMGVFGHVALPIGCVVCTARLDGAFQLGEEAEATEFPAATIARHRVSRPMPPCFTVRYDRFGDYSPGRWAWLLTDVQPLRPPTRAVGRQGFFELPQGWMTR